MLPCLLAIIAISTISAVDAATHPIPWSRLVAVTPEPQQRFGVEFELGWAGAPFGSAGHYDPNPCGGFKMPKDFRSFAIQNGHNVIYSAKAGSPLSKWHFSLDGEVYLELVSDPMTITEMKTELEKIKSVVTTSGKDLVKLLNSNFDRAYSTRTDIYDWFECHVGQKITPIGKVFPNSQLTTTFTDSELGSCHNELATEVAGHFKKSLLAVLQATTYVEGAKLTMPYLIKHCAEQFTAGVPASVTKNGGVIDKVDDTMGLHTSANKLAPLFDRNGEHAFVIEVRSKADPVNVALMEYMNGAAEDSKNWTALKKKLVCSAHLFY